MPSLEELTESARGRLGRVLKDKWRLDHLLGVGGMAAVYAATHRNKKRVAIKMLHAHLSDERRLRARFLREGYLANSVEHPSVVKVDDDEVDDDGSAFLVMELLLGETVDERRRARGGKLPAADVVTLAAELLDVLVVAHDHGIVHRDLKPENLFVLPGGALKVLDFGLARVLEPDGGGSSLTQPDAVLGTPAFMAPEQAVGRWDLVDGRTDLWAAGATMYRLLSGRYVHEGTTVQEQLVKAATANARPLSELVPDIPPSIASVVDRALSFARADRFEDARAMLAALVDASAKASLPLPALPERPRPPEEDASPSTDASLPGPTRDKPATSDLSLPATTRSTSHGAKTPGPSAGDSRQRAATEASGGQPSTPSSPTSRASAPWLLAGGLAVGALGALLLTQSRASSLPPPPAPPLASIDSSSQTSTSIAARVPAPDVAPIPPATSAAVGVSVAAPRAPGARPPASASATPVSSVPPPASAPPAVSASAPPPVSNPLDRRR